MFFKLPFEILLTNITRNIKEGRHASYGSIIIKMTKVKLCGLSRPCDIEYANELTPDYIGFVFAEFSKRYVSVNTAEMLSKKLNKEIVPVGVFVNESTDFIVDIIERKIIRAVQLHGNEDNSYIHRLQNVTDCMIIKAIAVRNEEDIKEANSSLADIVLLDTGCGTGRTFNWTLLKKATRPYFLAGGLTSDNVSEAISEFAPYGVDASTSIETDGYKDKQKMAAFINAVKHGKE